MISSQNISDHSGPVPEKLVGTEQHGHVLVITLQREKKRNAINRAMADQLDAALNELDDNADLRVGVLYGGNSVFCAGSDLAAGFDYNTERGGEYGLIRRRRLKPLIAAVEGPAFGGGLEIILACDMVVAAVSARFGLPEVRRGVLPSCGAIFRALQALSPNLARELVLTGKEIDGQRALAIGLVNYLVPENEALAHARALAELISVNAPLAVQASLKAMNDLLAEEDDRGWQAQSEALAAIHGSADVKEGINAFLEKRAPVWTGR